MGLFGVGPRNFGSNNGSVVVSRPGWTGPEFRTGPRVRNSEPDPNSAHENPVRPGPTVFDTTFCVDSQSEDSFQVVHWNHEFHGRFGLNIPSAN